MKGAGSICAVPVFQHLAGIDVHECRSPGKIPYPMKGNYLAISREEQARLLKVLDIYQAEKAFGAC